MGFGSDFVKVFPVSSLGPSHIRELRGPMREIELIATGGVDATNIAAYLEQAVSRSASVVRS